MKLNVVDIPKPKPTQHLVRVGACALNPVDYKPAEHPLMSRLLIKKPATPGLDIVGTIITPAQGSSLKPGQRIYGIAGATPFDDGGLREICTTEKISTLPLLDGLDPVGAGTITVAGLSAYQSIVPHVKKGDRVFLNGGSGGTGIFGIQIAKAAGCNVTTTCSARNVELCKSLGADEVIDYTKGSVVDALKGMEKFDHVVDNAGSDMDLYWRCDEYTKPKAQYIMVAGDASLSHMLQMTKAKRLPSFLGGGKRQISGFWPHPDPDHVGQIGKWMKEGKVKPVIDEKFAFENAPAAFTKLKTGRARGKIVVQVGPI